MDTELSQHQQALSSAMDKVLARYARLPVAEPTNVAVSDDLERDLVASGFLEVARTEGSGVFEAMLLVEAAAKIPYAIEVGASAIVAPQISKEPLPRPLALARAPLSGAIRYLPVAKAVLVDTGDDVRLLDLAGRKVTRIHSEYAYPIGKLEDADLSQARVLKGVTPAALHHWWQLAIAAESLGCMQASVDLTVSHLKLRRQFGHAIGSFQALQHRISECVTLVESLRVLVQKAAYSGDAADAAMAAFYAQESSPRIVTDTQQMHGAMGVTLEYPLHFFTYRLKVLQGELGGCSRQADRAAEILWN